MYKVLKNFKGSPDGYTVVEYVEGQEVDLPPSLVEVALHEKWVRKIKAKPLDEMITEAPEAIPDVAIGTAIEQPADADLASALAT